MAFFGGREQFPVGVLYGDEWFASSELIATAWTAFAGLAWAGYLGSGRGVLWLPQDAHQAADGPEYVPASKPSLLADRSAIMRRLRADLARYNPEREFVIFFSAARDLKAYHAGKAEEFEGVLRPAKGQLFPPEAYERLRQANERGGDMLAVAITPPRKR